MEDIRQKEFKAFGMFKDQWALATAGTIDNFNTCTIGWGSIGTIWTRAAGNIVTIYVNPERYTWEFLMNNDYFTVSFFPEEYRKDLQYLGTHSGRDEDKVAKTKLTPVKAGESVSFKEAELTFVCKKIYAAQFDKDKMDPEVYQAVYGYRDWITHYEFIGTVVDVIE
ncbi:MAG: flavin reductase [Erysipelotrichaceae bacterium]|nr:flavin reductase [Erysipelotrichaceae bacterium]